MGTKKSEGGLSCVAKSVLNFTTDFCKLYARTNEKSYVCSSLSAHIALSMAAYGANGNTALEMRQVLHIADDDSKLLEDYQRIIDILSATEDSDDDVEEQVNAILKEYSTQQEQMHSYRHRLRSFIGSYIPLFKNKHIISQGERNQRIENVREVHELRKKWDKEIECIATLANRIYISNEIHVREHYENALSTYFRSKSETLDYMDKQRSAQIINDWCSETTNGKINKIVDPNKFTDKTALLLINAVYFRGKWVIKFENAQPRTFYLSQSEQIQAHTMEIKEQLHYRNLEELDAKAVRLDFQKCTKYMEVIVPNKIDGLKTIEENLQKISQEFEHTYVHFWMPKFKINTEITFNEYLKKMGIKEAFAEALANFNKISESRLHIGEVLQKAYIDVNERGCEAAAVTKVEMLVNRCGQMWIKEPTYIEIKADRPFLFRIMDSRFNIPLFIGTVVNPNN